MTTAPHRPSPTRAAAGPRPALPRQELLAALIAERYRAPAPPAPPPGPGPSRRHAVPGTEQTTAYVHRLAGYGWTRQQISAVTGLTRQQVARALRTPVVAPDVESEAP